LTLKTLPKPIFAMVSATSADRLPVEQMT